MKKEIQSTSAGPPSSLPGQIAQAFRAPTHGCFHNLEVLLSLGILLIKRLRITIEKGSPTA